MLFGIYIHLPYCLTKCPYCDFNSYGTSGVFPEEDYTKAIVREIEFYYKIIESYKPVSVFFGGGTPSLFSPRSIETILNALNRLTSISSETEITIEVNPRTVDLLKLKGFRHAGVNRVSIGVQSFTQEKLDFLGRGYDVKDCKSVIEDTYRAGFENRNIDIIYGLACERDKTLEYDLYRCVVYGAEHISAYCLTIEEGTPFAKMRSKGILDLLSEDELANRYLLVSTILTEHGYGHYEISNFSKHGYRCRHNLLYWNSDNYLGIGAGAHSHLKEVKQSKWGMRWSNIRSPRHYMRAVFNGDLPRDNEEFLNFESAFSDYINMGMRVEDGISISYVKGRFGIEISRSSYMHFVEDGFIGIEDERIFLTKKGFLYSNSIISHIVSACVG